MTGIVLQSELWRACEWEVRLQLSWHILLTKALRMQTVLWPQGATPQGGPMSSCTVQPLCHTSECGPLGAWSSSKNNFGAIYM